jgi:hypothetical protein
MEISCLTNAEPRRFVGRRSETAIYGLDAVCLEAEESPIVVFSLEIFLLGRMVGWSGGSEHCARSRGLRKLKEVKV